MIYAIIHHYFAFLVDFRDFPTKSPSLVFNFWEEKILLFRFFIVSGTFWTHKNQRKKYLISFSPGEAPWAKESCEGSHEGQKRTGGASPLPRHTTYARFALEHCLGPTLYRCLRFSQKPKPYFSRDLLRRRRRRFPERRRSFCTAPEAFFARDLETTRSRRMPSGRGRSETFL